MISHRFTPYEKDPVSGHDQDPRYYDSEEVVISDSGFSSASFEEERKKLEERLAQYSVFPILEEAIAKAELLLNNPEIRVANKKDIHDVRNILGTIKGLKEYLESSGFKGNFGDLESKNKEIYQSIFDSLVDLNY